MQRLRIDASLVVHPYRQIAVGIQEQIASGLLTAGDRVPTCRELSAGLGVSVTTANRALALLAQKGLVVSRTRAGTVVAEASPPTTEVLVSSELTVTPGEAAQFYHQLIEGLQGAYGEPLRRCQLIYSSHTTAPTLSEILNVPTLDGVVAYRPWLALQETLRRAAQEVPCVSLFFPVPESQADCVVADPELALCGWIHQRLAEGKRRFAYLGMREEREAGSSCAPHDVCERVFHRYLADRGIEPIWRLMPAPPAALSVEEARRVVAGEGRALADGLEDDTVLLARTPAMASAFGEHFDRLDVITYTESRASVDALRGRCALLYMGLETIGAATVPLLRSRAREAAGTPGRTARLAPTLMPATRSGSGADAKA